MDRDVWYKLSFIGWIVGMIPWVNIFKNPTFIFLQFGGLVWLLFCIYMFYRSKD